jgi:hypothetical protein
MTWRSAGEMRTRVARGYVWDEETQAPMPSLLKRYRDQMRRRDARMVAHIAERFATVDELCACLKRHGWPQSEGPSLQIIDGDKQ